MKKIETSEIMDQYSREVKELIFDIYGDTAFEKRVSFNELIKLIDAAQRNPAGMEVFLARFVPNVLLLIWKECPEIISGNYFDLTDLINRLMFHLSLTIHKIDLTKPAEGMNLFIVRSLYWVLVKQRAQLEKEEKSPEELVDPFELEELILLSDGQKGRLNPEEQAVILDVMNRLQTDGSFLPNDWEILHSFYWLQESQEQTAERLGLNSEYVVKRKQVVLDRIRDRIDTWSEKI